MYELIISQYDSSDGTSGIRITNYSVADMSHKPLWVSIPFEQVEEVAKEMLEWVAAYNIPPKRKRNLRIVK